MAEQRPPLRFPISCGILLVPVILWNVALIEVLPSAFTVSEAGRDIPSTLAFAENALRAIVFVLPFAMPLEASAPEQRRGLFVFALGTLVHFASWLPLMISPGSQWSTSAAGFMAPAWTPALWLFGIALLGRRLYWGRFYRWWMYLVVSGAFLVAHIWHAALVYARSQ